MPMWGKVDQANSAPKNQFVTQATANGEAAYGNVTVGAFTAKQAVGIFGVTDAEAQVSGAMASPGWTKITQGTGPVVSLTVADGGTGYSNTDVGTISGGTSNASFTVVTDGDGIITAATVTGGGAGFKNVGAATVAVANSTGGASAGADAEITPVLGGRAGRVQYETLVALSSMSGDGSDDTLLPDA